MDTSLSSSIPINVDEAEEDGSVSKMSDTETRISHLEMHFSRFTSSFQTAISELKRQSKLQEENQSKQEKALVTILELLQNQNISSATPSDQQASQVSQSNHNHIGLLSVPADRANSPNQLNESGGSTGTAGTGS